MFESEAKFFHVLLEDDRVDGQFILNVGSGTTQHLEKYAPFYFAEIRQCLIDRRNILANLDLKEGGGIDVVADCHHMPLDDGSVDVALFFSLIEHVLRPHQVIDEIHRILKASGVCYASVPADGYPCHQDPIDSLLRLSTLKEWEQFFRAGSWDITLFKQLDVYHPRLKRRFSITAVKVEKKGP